jgi:hypothetical protein
MGSIIWVVKAEYMRKLEQRVQIRNLGRAAKENAQGTTKYDKMK